MPRNNKKIFLKGLWDWPLLLFALLVVLFFIEANDIRFISLLASVLPENEYEGEIVLTEYSEDGKARCFPMSCSADEVSEKMRCVSEGYVESDREIDGGKLNIKFKGGGSVVEYIGNAALYDLKLKIYNYEADGWDVIVSLADSGNAIQYTYDIGEELPRGYGTITEPKQCTPWYEYSGYDKKTCSFWDFTISEDHIDPETNKRVKIRIDMYVEGRGEDNSNVLEVSSIDSDFTFSDIVTTTTTTTTTIPPSEVGWFCEDYTCKWRCLDGSEVGFSLLYPETLASIGTGYSYEDECLLGKSYYTAAGCSCPVDGWDCTYDVGTQSYVLHCSDCPSSIGGEIPHYAVGRCFESELLCESAEYMGLMESDLTDSTTTTTIPDETTTTTTTITDDIDKDPCPYECCVDDDDYEDKSCPSGSRCSSNNLCHIIDDVNGDGEMDEWFEDNKSWVIPLGIFLIVMVVLKK